MPIRASKSAHCSSTSQSSRRPSEDGERRATGADQPLWLGANGVGRDRVVTVEDAGEGVVVAVAAIQRDRLVARDRRQGSPPRPSRSGLQRRNTAHANASSGLAALVFTTDARRRSNACVYVADQARPRRRANGGNLAGLSDCPPLGPWFEFRCGSVLDLGRTEASCDRRTPRRVSLPRCSAREHLREHSAGTSGPNSCPDVFPPDRR